MPTAEAPPARRPARVRRRLRTRIILSFAVFGLALTALIAATTVYLRNRVENQVLGAALEKNNNAFAEGFYLNPNAVGIPFEKIQGRQFSTRKLDRVPPEWRDLPNGVHEISMRDPVTPRPAPTNWRCARTRTTGSSSPTTSPRSARASASWCTR